jgi:biopolymer transport protein ExbD
MFAINFAQAEQDERIRLPDSVLAKPPDTPLEYPITLNMTKHGGVIFGGQELFLEGLPLYLRREAALLENRERQVNDATVIIRADKDAATGEVQRLVNVCQEQGFAKFALRAKEDVGN